MQRGRGRRRGRGRKRGRNTLGRVTTSNGSQMRGRGAERRKRLLCLLLHHRHDTVSRISVFVLRPEKSGGEDASCTLRLYPRDFHHPFCNGFSHGCPMSSEDWHDQYCSDYICMSNVDLNLNPTPQSEAVRHSGIAYPEVSTTRPHAFHVGSFH